MRSDLPRAPPTSLLSILQGVLAITTLAISITALTFVIVIYRQPPASSTAALIDFGVNGTYQTNDTLAVFSLNTYGLVTNVTAGSARLVYNTTEIAGPHFAGTYGSPLLAPAGFAAGSCGDGHFVSKLNWTTVGTLGSMPECTLHDIAVDSAYYGTVNQIVVNNSVVGIVEIALAPIIAAGSCANGSHLEGVAYDVYGRFAAAPTCVLNEASNTYAGTVYRVNVNTSVPGLVTFSTDQDLAPSSNVQFNNALLTGTVRVGPLATLLGRAEHTVTGARPNTEYYVAGGNGYPVLQLGALGTDGQWLASNAHLDTSGGYRYSLTGVAPVWLSFNGSTVRLGGSAAGTAGAVLASQDVYLAADAAKVAAYIPLHANAAFEARTTLRAGVPRPYDGTSPFVFFGTESSASSPAIDLVVNGSAHASAQLAARSPNVGFLAFGVAYKDGVGFVAASATAPGMMWYKTDSEMTLRTTPAAAVGTVVAAVDLAVFTPSLFTLKTPSAIEAALPSLSWRYVAGGHTPLFAGALNATHAFLGFDMYADGAGAYRAGRAAGTAFAWLKGGADEVGLYAATIGSLGAAVTPAAVLTAAGTYVMVEPVTYLKGGFIAGPLSTRSGINKYSLGGDATIHLEVYATGQDQPRGNAYAWLATGNSHVAFDAYHDGSAYRFASATRAGLLLRKSVDSFLVQFNPVATTPTLGGAFTPETRFSVTSALTAVYNSLLVESAVGSNSLRMQLTGSVRPHLEVTTFGEQNMHLGFDMYWDGANFAFTGTTASRSYLIRKQGNVFQMQTSTAAGSGGTTATLVNVWTVTSQVMTITLAPIIGAFSAFSGRRVVVGTSGVLEATTAATTIEQGGTNSVAALVGDRVMVSNTGATAIVESTRFATGAASATDMYLGLDAYYNNSAYRFLGSAQAGFLVRNTANTLLVQMGTTTPVAGGVFTPAALITLRNDSTTLHSKLIVEDAYAISSRAQLRRAGDIYPRTEWASFGTDNHYLSFDMGYREDGVSNWVATSESVRGYIFYKTAAALYLQTSAPVAIGTTASRVTVWSVSAQVMTLTDAPVIGAFSANVGARVVVGAAGVLATTTAALTVADGGTNSITALVNGRVMVSSGGAIVESAYVFSNTTETSVRNLLVVEATLPLVHMRVTGEGLPRISAGMLDSTSSYLAFDVARSGANWVVPVASRVGYAFITTNSAMTFIRSGSSGTVGATVGTVTVWSVAASTDTVTFAQPPIISAWSALAGRRVVVGTSGVLETTTAATTIAQGGTNSVAALVNGRVMVSSGGAIVEADTTGLWSARVTSTTTSSGAIATTFTWGYQDTCGPIVITVSRSATLTMTATGDITVGSIPAAWRPTDDRVCVTHLDQSSPKKQLEVCVETTGVITIRPLQGSWAINDTLWLGKARLMYYPTN